MRIHEWFCTFVDRDLTKCAEHIFISNRNIYQAPQLASAQGWLVSFAGFERCPEHAPQDGPKVKNK